jgi:hypothetical protein
MTNVHAMPGVVPIPSGTNRAERPKEREIWKMT